MQNSSLKSDSTYTLHSLNIQELYQNPVFRTYSDFRGKVSHILTSRLHDGSVVLGLKEAEYEGEITITTYVLGYDGNIFSNRRHSHEIEADSIPWDLFYMTLNPLQSYKRWILTRDLGIHGTTKFDEIGSSLDTLDIHPYFYKCMKHIKSLYKEKKIQPFAK